MATGEIVVGLDIGTTKVCTIVGERSASGTLEIIGYGVQPSRGVKKGQIVDLEGTVKAIEESIIDAEEMADVDIDSVYIGIGGPGIASFMSKGVIGLPGGSREISDEDKERALEAARAIPLDPNRELIHAIPLEYMVDEQSGIRDPLGMIGTRLQVNAHLVSGTGTMLKNVIKAVRGSGLQIRALVLQALASAEAVLTPDEKELGVVVVDIGGGTTDLAVFREGMILHSAVLPVGGDHVTGDVAVGLVVPPSVAEELKRKHATLDLESVPVDEYLEAQCTDRDTRKKISRLTLCEIVAARMEEILEMVRAEIQRNGLTGMIPSGIVFTGGGAKLEGLVPVAAEYFGRPARIGRPFGIQDLTEKTASPKFATAIGLMVWGLQAETLRIRGRRKREGWVRQTLSWMRDWIRDLF